MASDTRGQFLEEQAHKDTQELRQRANYKRESRSTLPTDREDGCGYRNQGGNVNYIRKTHGRYQHGKVKAND